MIKYFTLHNGIDIPSIGFGTWKIGSGKTAKDVVNSALMAGYMHIDTAASYGNELAIGKALRDSDLRREDIFVASKLWTTQRRYDDAIQGYMQSLKRLKLEYLDLFMIHLPASSNEHDNWVDVNNETWSALEKLYNDGLVRAIGVCNFYAHHMEPLLQSAKTIPMVNQIEYHPGMYKKASKIKDICKEHSIIVEAWSPLGMGTLLDNPVLMDIARRYRKSTAQICIRWCIQNNTVPIPKSANAKRMEENLSVYDFEISPSDMETLNAMDNTGYSGVDPDGDLSILTELQ